MKISSYEYRSGEKLYECSDCLGHHASADRLTSCPECGGPVKNITKPRAE
ncbi:rubrerythrin-like domain-containing protein [Halolamina salina]|uniref:Rubrerythrin-like domain-containing protein n=1 Tax=Halolamina salina TaxID=1220023 RepID=A0ABD6B4D0_9EURY